MRPSLRSIERTASALGLTRCHSRGRANFPHDRREILPRGAQLAHLVSERGPHSVTSIAAATFGRWPPGNQENSQIRKLSHAVAASLLVFGLAGRAHAVVLGFTGTLAIQIVGLDPVEISGAGNAIVNGDGEAGHLKSLHIPASPFAVTGFIVPVTDPSVLPINGVQVTAHNGEGNFDRNPADVFSGTMAVKGAAKVCLFGTCADSVANLVVPLSVVGVGGFAIVKGAVNLTVIGAPWTTGTARVGNQTTMGGVRPLSNTGAPSGEIHLVTPIFISTNIGSSSVVPAFGLLSLHFVPEPGTLILLGSGIAGFAGFGRNRARG